MSLLFIALTACDLFNAESVGAYTCDEYCGEVIDKTDECAEEACAACRQSTSWNARLSST